MTSEEVGAICQEAAVEIAKRGLSGAPLSRLALKAAAAQRAEIRREQAPYFKALRSVVPCYRLKGCTKNGSHADECARGELFALIKNLQVATRDR